MNMGYFFKNPTLTYRVMVARSAEGTKRLRNNGLEKQNGCSHWGNIRLKKTKYTHARDKVVVTCAEHGDFLTLPRDFLRGHGCPKCQMSKLEASVEEKLLEQNIVFERQKKFLWLSGMSFDFYIKSENKAKIDKEKLENKEE